MLYSAIVMIIIPNTYCAPSQYVPRIDGLNHVTMHNSEITLACLSMLMPL